MTLQSSILHWKLIKLNKEIYTFLQIIFLSLELNIKESWLEKVQQLMLVSWHLGKWRYTTIL